MSDAVMSGRADPGAPSAFSPRIMVPVAIAGVLAFIAMLVLGAYAPQLRSGKNGGGHALSNSAVGFSAIVRLAESTGHNPRIVRRPDMLDSENLVVLTPEWTADISNVLGLRSAKATLIVLPKWAAVRDPKRPAWVKVQGLAPTYVPQGVLAPAYELAVIRRKGRGEALRTVPDYVPADMRFIAPPVVQSVAGKGLEPIVVDPGGQIVLGKLGGGPLYVLADPDLLDNHGMANARQARAALAMLDYLNSNQADGILFDVTLNGLGIQRSPLKLAFDPPFLGVTLTIFAALLLAGIQAAVRFGAPRRRERAIAFGKAALVDNSAALVRRARREARVGRLYADVVRERIAALFRIPAAARGPALDERLDGLKTSRPFSELARQVSEARDRNELLAAARALHHWQTEVET